MPALARLLALFTLTLTCGGCLGGMNPTAARTGYLANFPEPRGDVAFVERGRRGTGAFIAVTAGGKSAFQVGWRTVLVPTPHSPTGGPRWTGPRPDRQTILNYVDLPDYRGPYNLERFADLARLRFGDRAIWILGTDPLILGLAAGDPRRTWREYAASETGVVHPERFSPLDAFLDRFAVGAELAQPLARVAFFPDTFWRDPAWAGGPDGWRKVKLAVATLPAPLTVDQALDALEAGTLRADGPADAVPLDFPTYDAGTLARKQDRQRREADRVRPR